MIFPHVRILALAAATSIATVSGAHSADLPLGPPVVPEFSGWYLRGDIGFSDQSVGSLFNVNYANFASVSNVDKGFDAAPFFGLGYTVNLIYNPMEFHHLTSQDVKLGVRFNLGGYDYQPPPPPLRSKG